MVKNFLIFIIVILNIVFLQSCIVKEKIILDTPAGKKLQLEVALTPQAREQGLMFRKILKPNTGMVFVFKETRVVNFWMKNTSIPLSIAYADTQGIVVHIADMEPFSLDPVTSIYPVRYAIEVNKGAFKNFGITQGTQLHIPASLLKKVE